VRVKRSTWVIAGIALTMAAHAFFTGCATTGGGAGQPQVSPERQKAIQDSLTRIWDRQLNIAWSTGYENHKGKMYEDAIKPFWRVVELDTVQRFPDLYTFLGDCYMKLNKPDSALIVYTMGAERFSQKSHYHRSMAYLLSAKNENEPAIEAYQKALEIDPENVADLQAVGNLLIQADRNDEALEVYQNLTELEPDNAENQRLYAQLLRTTGDEDAVLEAQEKALEADPNNTRLMFSLGESYFKRGENQKAIEKFEQMLDIKPDEVYALEYLGNAQQNEGLYRDAIATYEKVLALQPDHKKVLCEMATCYRELKNYSRARSLANQALKIDPQFGLARIVRGEIYESVVDDCIGRREKRIVNFDDKLVYKLAYDEYALAAKDPFYTDVARRKMNYIKPDIPTTEDYFMHPDEKQADLDCYRWIY